MMWQLFIEPNDVLLFRDGKPFTAGEDHRAHSIFPPTPFTMQGVVRSKILFDSGVSLSDYAHGAPSAQDLIRQIGRPGGNYGQLRLRGPFVTKRNGDTFMRYFPLPADVVMVDKHLFDLSADYNQFLHTGTVSHQIRKAFEAYGKELAMTARVSWDDRKGKIADDEHKKIYRLQKTDRKIKVYLADDPTLVKPLSANCFSSNIPDDLYLLWVRTDKPIKEARGWLEEDEFQKYLSGQTELRVTSESDLVVCEPRLGIALDPVRRSAKERMLYTMEFLRLRENVGFLLEVDGIPPFRSEKGLLQVGGEARAAIYEVLKTPLPAVSPPNPLPKQFKVVLLTPAWFSGGWRPQGDNWGQFFDGANVRLVAAALPRAQPIGGALVDDVRRRADFQKVMHSFVPAGSVFFFESEGAATYNGKPFTETPRNEGDFGQIGFGCVAITEWEFA